MPLVDASLQAVQNVQLVAQALGDNVTTLLVALAAGSLSALITGIFARPKTGADAEASRATANVTLSQDAREWAQLWMQKAEEAEQRAKSAEIRAEAAEEKADSADHRVHQLTRRMEAYSVYTRILQRELNRLGGHVPEPPPELMFDHD